MSIAVQLCSLHTEVGLTYGNLVKKAIMTTVLPLIPNVDEWNPTIGRLMIAISVIKSMITSTFSHGTWYVSMNMAIFVSCRTAMKQSHLGICWKQKMNPPGATGNCNTHWIDAVIIAASRYDSISWTTGCDRSDANQTPYYNKSDCTKSERGYLTFPRKYAPNQNKDGAFREGKCDEE